ncbi:DUF3251 domain-containing protein [Serratia rubidaea]|nr:DUF3251 domain-containing protein [Serratia rubidaea]
MTISYPKVCLLTALILLAGCAQNRDVPNLRNQVGELSQKVTTLTEQATALERQKQLNQGSTSGVYLLPAANTPARLQSNIGELSVALDRVKSEANGSQAVLHIRTLSGKTLPAFKAMVEWGRLDDNGQLQNAGALSQPIQNGDSLLAKTTQSFELRFSDVTPEQLGYIRLHSVEPLTAESR